jgi:Icc-related predicted phosphoesterase
MKILVVADLHYALKQFDWLLANAPDFEAVVIAGDLLEIASIVGVDAQIVVIRTYLKRISAKTRLIVCSGNHDLDENTSAGERVAGWLQDLGAAEIVKDGERLQLGPVLVSVFPWWDGPATRDVIARQMERDAPTDGTPWIWVYHAPPNDSPTSWGGSRYFGDPELAAWIRQRQPDIVLSGHVHQAPFIGQGAWADRVGQSWVFNMGQQPGDMPAHIIFDPVQGKAMWHSIAGTEELDLRKTGARPEPVQGVPGWLT